MSEPGSGEPGSGEPAYAKVLTKLFAARRAGIDFGLDRMRHCLEKLNLQHRPRAVVQVAGTNGKGSTSRFLEEILRCGGVSVGVFSSPHLLTIRERFRIDDKKATRAEFMAAFDAIRALGVELTFFEYATGIAAWLFDRAKVDVAIYEVGLGGRLDSTTALPSTLSIVSGIGLDHCEFLGATLEEIALEKAGIFRQGVPAIIGLSAEARIRALLAAQADRALMVDGTHLAAVPPNLRMLGDHQRHNAACAVLAARTLRDEQGIAWEDRHLTDGLSTAQLAGRMHQAIPGVWVDGAHNAQAAQSLAELLEGQAKMVLVVGLSSNKEIAGFLAPLRPHVLSIIATQGQGDRAYPAEHIAEAARALGFESVELEHDATRALQRARTHDADVLVTGSLLLLGEILRGLGYPDADPVVVSDPGKARQ